MAELVPPDLLSNLPLGIIHDILGRLPILEAVSTSILSSHWRYNWTTLPNLFFDDDTYDLKECRYWSDNIEANDKVINSVFSQHKGPIHRFEMSYRDYIDIDFIEEWLLFLERNDIRELIIAMGYNEDVGSRWLGSSIYTCTKLTKLELWYFVIGEMPPLGFKGFLFLTILSLKGVCVEGVKILLANSPLLEILTILQLFDDDDDDDDDNPVRITVNAPNLKYMDLGGHITELCLYAPLLAVMRLDLENGDFQLGLQSLDSNYVSFFRCFTNLEQLRGHNYFIQYLSIGIQSCHHTLEVHRLKVIELGGVNFADTKETMVVVRLIIEAPNLHSLQIEPSDAAVRSGVSFKDFGFTPNFTLKKLKVLSLYNVCDYLFGRQLIKFLLESSPALETLSLTRPKVVLQSGVSFNDFGFAPNFTFKKLKVASMGGICDYLFGRQFIKFLLESSPALETLSLTRIDKQVSAELLGFRRASPNARILVTVY